MQPITLLGMVLQLAEHFEAKHNRKPTRIHIPVRYSELLESQFSEGRNVNTLQRILELSWAKHVNVTMERELISVD